MIALHGNSKTAVITVQCLFLISTSLSASPTSIQKIWVIFLSKIDNASFCITKLNQPTEIYSKDIQKIPSHLFCSTWQDFTAVLWLSQSNVNKYKITLVTMKKSNSLNTKYLKRTEFSNTHAGFKQPKKIWLFENTQEVTIWRL